MEDATKTNPILEDLVDLNNGAVGFLGSTIRHIVYMQYHIRHLSLSPTTHNKHKTQTMNDVEVDYGRDLVAPRPHFSLLSSSSI